MLGINTIAQGLGKRITSHSCGRRLKRYLRAHCTYQSAREDHRAWIPGARGSHLFLRVLLYPRLSLALAGSIKTCRYKNKNKKGNHRAPTK